MTAFSKVTFKAQPRWASLRALERLLRPVLGSKALRVPVAQNGREKRENLKVVEVTALRNGTLRNWIASR